MQNKNRFSHGAAQLDSITPFGFISETARPYLASVTIQIGLSFTCSKPSKYTFSLCETKKKQVTDPLNAGKTNLNAFMIMVIMKCKSA